MEREDTDRALPTETGTDTDATTTGADPAIAVLIGRVGATRPAPAVEALADRAGVTYPTLLAFTTTNAIVEKDLQLTEGRVSSYAASFSPTL